MVQVYDGLGYFGCVGVVQYVLYEIVVDFQVFYWEVVEVVEVGEVGIEVVYCQWYVVLFEYVEVVVQDVGVMDQC